LNEYGFVANNPITAVDYIGLRDLYLEFNAFIPGSIGKPASSFLGSAAAGILGGWLDEPGGVSYIVETSNRGFGGGSSKAKSFGVIRTEDIGKMEGKTLRLHTKSDPSRRIKIGLLSGKPVIESGTESPSWTVKIKDVSPCESHITFKASAQYPLGLVPDAFVPNIDYEVTFVLKAQGSERKSGTIKIKGTHNIFPNYEGNVDHNWVYYFSTSETGPTIDNLNSSTTFETSPTTWNE